MKVRGISKIDVIVGGPPCQAYSLAGRAQSSHMKVPMAEDLRDIELAKQLMGDEGITKKYEIYFAAYMRNEFDEALEFRMSNIRSFCAAFCFQIRSALKPDFFIWAAALSLL